MDVKMSSENYSRRNLIWIEVQAISRTILSLNKKRKLLFTTFASHEFIPLK
jgi:hypothetical protein